MSAAPQKVTGEPQSQVYVKVKVDLQLKGLNAYFYMGDSVLVSQGKGLYAPHLLLPEHRTALNILLITSNTHTHARMHMHARTHTHTHTEGSVKSCTYQHPCLVLSLELAEQEILGTAGPFQEPVTSQACVLSPCKAVQQNSMRNLFISFSQVILSSLRK